MLYEILTGAPLPAPPAAPAATQSARVLLAEDNTVHQRVALLMLSRLGSRADLAAELTRAGSRKLAALQEWVRQGGHLVVCHPTEAFRIAPFADAQMLPVHLTGPDGKAVAALLDTKAAAATQTASR